MNSRYRIIGNLTQKIRNAYKKRDGRKLKKIYSICLNKITMEFDNEMFLLSLISYMLSKLMTKPRYWKSPSIKRYLKRIDSLFVMVMRGATAKKSEDIGNALNEILQLVNSLDAEDMRHINSLIENGKIKIAATLYAKGISLGRVAEMTGVDTHDILLYTGKTRMADRLLSKISIKERLRRLKKLGTR